MVCKGSPSQRQAVGWLGGGADGLACMICVASLLHCVPIAGATPARLGGQAAPRAILAHFCWLSQVTGGTWVRASPGTMQPQASTLGADWA